jgi:hypothetical protein
LESFGRARRRPSRFGPIVPAFAGDSSQVLLNRIQEILGMMPQNRRFNAWPVVVFPVAVALAVVAMMQPVGAEEKPVQQAKPVPAPARAPAEVEERMISYEVRLLEVGPGPRNRLPEADLKSSDGTLEFTFLSEPELSLVLQAAENPFANLKLITAPKVTSWDGASATIIDHDDPKSSVKGLEAPGLAVTMRGTIADGQLQMTYEIGRTCEEMGGDPGVKSRMKCSHPDGTTIAFWPKDRSLRIADGRERVILVTSRLIITEKEEEALGRSP